MNSSVISTTWFALTANVNRQTLLKLEVYAEGCVTLTLVPEHDSQKITCLCTVNNMMYRRRHQYMMLFPHSKATVLGSA